MAPLRSVGPPTRPFPVASSGGGRLPDRYTIREEEEGRRLLACSEAPTVRVHLERGLSFTRANARNAAKGSIFLDGVAEGEPFLDVKRHVYNLDHHDGIVRAFTLATCEQAMVLVRRGFDLQAREWTVYANEPDLDTLLAIWVLLNHIRLRADESPARAAVMPLIRLEGCIDVHGLERLDFCGFSPQRSRMALEGLEKLGRREAELKETGEWASIDYLEYTRQTLAAVDELIYAPGDFEEEAGVEELARAELPNGRFAVACRGGGAIYDAEKSLRRLYGERLGVVVFEKSPGVLTLRQVDPFLPASLEEVYEELNLVDPLAGHRGSGNRWGGSVEIGGSPRRSGSGLTVRRVLGVLARANARPHLGARFRAVGRVAGVIVFLLLAALAAQLAVTRWSGAAVGGLDAVLLGQVFTATLLALAGGAWWLGGRRARGYFGMRLPGGRDWLWREAPILLALGLLGGAWAPTVAADAGQLPASAALTALGLGLAVEILFRGWAYGELSVSFGAPGRRPLARPSAAVWICALLYGAAALLPGLPEPELTAGWTAPARLVAQVSVGLLFGWVAGHLRERTESLYPGALVHSLAAVLLLL